MTSNAVTFRSDAYDVDFRLSFLGYDFPDIETGLTANWLVVKSECRHKGQAFSAQYPCLTTAEIKRIAQWFLDIGNNDIPKHTDICFIEPNLEFRLGGNSDGMIRFIILLSQEFKPPFKSVFTGQALQPDDEFCLAFDYPFDAMKAFGQQFLDLAAAFPQRGSLKP